MKAVHEFLGITEDQHNAYLLELWKNWAESVSGSTRQWQKIVANAAINRWFLRELAKIEADFVSKVSRYEGSNATTVIDHRKCFQSCIVEIFNHYPKPLIEEIRKDSFGPVEIATNGIKTFTSLNLN